MKQKVLFIFVYLFIPIVVSAQEAYAVYSDGTLSFYYDQYKETRTGTIYSVDKFRTNEDNGWGSMSNTITTVIFGSSFENYHGLTSTRYWFYNCTKISTIDGLKYLNTENVIDMKSMFYGCESILSLDLLNFNTANVINMEDMFYNCHSLSKLDLSSFITSKVQDMSAMFSRCNSLTRLDLSNFDTSSVLYITGMFYGCSSLTVLDASNFDTSNVIEASNAFGNCSSLTTIYAGESWSQYNKVGDLVKAFDGCTKLMGGKGTSFNSAYWSNALIDGGYDSRGYLTDKALKNQPLPYATLSDEGKTLTFYYDKNKETRSGVVAFQSSKNSCYPSITKAIFDVSFADFLPYTTDYWFNGCNELTTIIGIENLNTSNVIWMLYMFQNCSSLLSLDIR